MKAQLLLIVCVAAALASENQQPEVASKTQDLFSAINQGNDTAVELLIKQGADLNAIDVYRSPIGKTLNGTPLMAASAEGHDRIVKLLVQNGADVNLKGLHGVSALLVATALGQESIVKYLLKNGADANIAMDDDKDDYDTPLQFAAHKGQDKMVELLIHNGADVNKKSKHGLSPLFLAVYYGYESTVKLLIEKGADLNKNYENGHSPLDMAMEQEIFPFSGRDNMVKLLTEMGARPFNAQHRL